MNTYQSFETPEPHLACQALRNAFPYLRLYQGTTFVIKAGGEAFDDDPGPILEQVSILHRLGIRVVLVHGGGPQATRTAQRLGLEPHFVDGRRVTCKETLDAVTMTLRGSVNAGIVAAFRGFDTRAVGLSGIDGDLVVARRRTPQARENGETIDLGHVGDLVAVNPGAVERLIDDGFLPVISPLSADAAGNILNVNADTVAAELAVSLRASKLFFLTGAPGILRSAADPGSLVSYTDLAGLTALGETGAIEAGMMPKVAGIRRALLGGVARVHVISHRAPDSLLLEVFTNEGSGTLVVGDMGETGAAQPATGSKNGTLTP